MSGLRKAAEAGMGIIGRLIDDYICLRGALRALARTTPIAKNPSRVFPAVIAELAEIYGDAPALISSRETFSYRQLAARANRYARWARRQGVAKGDTVCLLMENRPEFMAIWLGITQIGGVAALLNTNLTGSPLARCIDAVNPKLMIGSAALAATLQSVQPHLANSPATWLHGAKADGWPRVDVAVELEDGSALAPSEKPALSIEDRALYIYTSGTTGLPKPANINHYRLMLAAYGFAGVMDTKSTDRIYDCLPMYHTAGGLCATGAVLVSGGSVVIREKFSAREFWSDVGRSQCTLVQYIGEFCRYLLHTPPQPDDTAHRVRLFCGNGLSPDVWPKLKERFKIPRIIEFYAATEGNVMLFNFDGKEGAIGRIPWFFKNRFPVDLVRIDVQSEQPIRNSDGFCVSCAAGEPGEAIGKILRDPAKPGARFEGYATHAETEKKVLRNVFEAGDAWFRTGDLMRRDESDYYYFVDRIGDTFRWKGENVSTTEVAGVLAEVPGVIEANVFGVGVPGAEGRAGMAALVIGDAFDVATLRAEIVRSLPRYAQPLFLRIKRELEVTATFKQRKVELVSEGFDPKATTDRLYFNDPRVSAFVPLDAALHDQIVTGTIRL
jgi:fatty-acyl-CoA synthase